jgi:hypothetical protein
MKLTTQSVTVALYIGLEVLSAVALKISVVWNVTPYSPIKFSPHFGVIYFPHSQSLGGKLVAVATVLLR